MDFLDPLTTLSASQISGLDRIHPEKLQHFKRFQIKQGERRSDCRPLSLHFFKIAVMNFVIPAGKFYFFFSASSMNRSCFRKIQLSAPPLFFFFFFHTHATSSSNEATSDGSGVPFCDLFFFCLSRVQEIILISPFFWRRRLGVSYGLGGQSATPL